MSFIHSHYEKIALAAGGLVLIGCSYLGVLGLKEAEQFIKSNDGGLPKNTPGDVLKNSVRGALNILGQDNQLKSKQDPQNPDNQVFIFKSVILYGKSGDPVPFNPESPDAAEVHPGIPNKYWFDNDLQEMIVYENATELDPDGDGFSIEEEFQAGTNPTDKSSYPSLLSKVGADDVLQETIKFNFDSVGPGKIFPSLRHIERKLKINEYKELLVGQKFPRDKPRGKDLGDLMQRFELTGLENRKVEDLGRVQGCAIYKDLITNREITVFKSGTVFKDRRVFLFLDALNKGGEAAVGLRPGQKFSLPFGGEPKTFLVEDISGNGADGSTFTVKLSGPNGEKREIDAKAR